MVRQAVIAMLLGVAGSVSPSAANRQVTAATADRSGVKAEQVRTAIDTLGSVEFPGRTAAARTVRRSASALAVPALTRAVTSHADEYVRFRALVVLTGFNDARTRDLMLKMIADRNDRIRAVAYSWFER